VTQACAGSRTFPGRTDSDPLPSERDPAHRLPPRLTSHPRDVGAPTGNPLVNPSSPDPLRSGARRGAGPPATQPHLSGGLSVVTAVSFPWQCTRSPSPPRCSWPSSPSSCYSSSGLLGCSSSFSPPFSCGMPWARAAVLHPLRRAEPFRDPRRPRKRPGACRTCRRSCRPPRSHRSIDRFYLGYEVPVRSRAVYRLRARRSSRRNV
jgi:hypothetical protein